MAALRNNVWDDLLAEFPVLMDSKHFGNREIRERCQRQLLEKCNQISRIPFTMEKLKKKLKVISNKRKYRTRRQTILDGDIQGNPKNRVESSTPSSPEPIMLSPSIGRPCQLDNLVAAIPIYRCLWDPEDLNYMDPALMAQCRDQLLIKYNSLSSLPITMDQLMSELDALRSRLDRERRQRQGLSGEDSRSDCWLDQETCSDTTKPTNQIQRVTQNKPEQQTAIFTIVFHCCGVCGEIKGECSQGINKSYIVKNKTTLAMNNLSIELDFNKDVMICQNCDIKLRETYEFVKLVSSAQYKFGKQIVNIDLTENEMPIDVNDDQTLIIDSLTVTDTKLVTPTVLQKRKREETLETKKKCSVTIDLNISDDNIDEDRAKMDDIEAKYQRFKKGDASLAKSADEVSKAVTKNSEDAILKLKTIIERDINKGVNATGENGTYDYRRNYIESYTHHGDNEDSEDIDVKKEIVSEIINEVNETGEIVADDDDKMNEAGTERTCVSEKTNEAGTEGTCDSEKTNEAETERTCDSEKTNEAETERTCDSEKTNATASETSELANKSEPMCVMPQSDLILLVESIVSRMLNK